MENLSRRAFCATIAAAALPAQSRYASLRVPAEWSWQSNKRYGDPFHEIELDVVITAPSGRELRVPAFWAGENIWRVRFAAQETGRHRYRTICTDTSNAELHGRAGALEVEDYQGENPLYRHGFVRAGEDKRHFEHADGTPFFWLGDTWWMGLTKRLTWPDGFQRLTADRVAKGFTVVQIVAGIYPDMPAFDPRGENEAGQPWSADYARINPAYFDMADLRMQYLAEAGLIACVVGAWGYYLPIMGVEKIKKHWRYLIARWGAYPVLWCLAGEGTMPYYLSKTHDQDVETQKRGWTEVARYVRKIDPYSHPITIHPSSSARKCVDDPAVLDFDMLQTGHDDRRSAPNTVETIRTSLAAAPRMPVLVGEVCYEGIQEASREEVQRFMFWASVLSGTAGHTYGANGIWQVNTRERPYGLSPHGHSWGDTPWEVAYQLPGSRQLGLAKKLLAQYRWWKLEPASDLIEPHWSKENYWQPFSARIPGELVIAFSPVGWRALEFKNLSSGMRAYFWNPTDATEYRIGEVTPDAAGNWRAPEFPVFRDWVVVLESAAARVMVK